MPVPIGTQYILDLFFHDTEIKQESRESPKPAPALLSAARFVVRVEIPSAN